MLKYCSIGSGSSGNCHVVSYKDTGILIDAGLAGKRITSGIEQADFDIDKICNYTEDKIKELEENKDIIRNKLKIKASINNTKIFKDIKEEYGSFKKYLLTFTNNKIYYEINMASSELSDNLSKDLRKRGMTFVGTTIIYSYLQAIGIIYSHDRDCYLYKEGNCENS